MKRTNSTLKNENWVAIMVIAAVFLITGAITLIAMYVG